MSWPWWLRPPRPAPNLAPPWPKLWRPRTGKMWGSRSNASRAVAGRGGGAAGARAGGRGGVEPERVTAGRSGGAGEGAAPQQALGLAGLGRPGVPGVGDGAVGAHEVDGHVHRGRVGDPPGEADVAAREVELRAAGGGLQLRSAALSGARDDREGRVGLDLGGGEDLHRARAARLHRLGHAHRHGPGHGRQRAPGTRRRRVEVPGLDGHAAVVAAADRAVEGDLGDAAQVAALDAGGRASAQALAGGAGGDAADLPDHRRGGVGGAAGRHGAALGRGGGLREGVRAQRAGHDQGKEYGYAR